MGFYRDARTRFQRRRKSARPPDPVMPDPAASRGPGGIWRGSRWVAGVLMIIALRGAEAMPAHPNPTTRAVECAPVLRVHPAEFFPLRDVVAVLHPEYPVIGYHLFWGDDIAYPRDGEPSDHEIVWVGYAPGHRGPVRLWTYFHGLVLTDTVATARPTVNVQWGRHGSLPAAWGTRRAWPARVVLLVHYLLDRVRRRNGLPEIRTWPARFHGSLTRYLCFDRVIDLRPVVAAGPVHIDRAPAALLRRTREYRFREKIAWPILDE